MSSVVSSKDDASGGGLPRREFLALATSAAGAVMFTGCQPPPPQHEFQAESRVRLAEDVVSAYENWYASVCRQCDAGCGIIVRIIEGRSKKVEGNPDHPVNQGKLCARGQAILQEQYHPDRIPGPLRRTGNRGVGTFQPASWDEGLNDVAGRLRDLQQRGQGNTIAILTPPLRGHQGLIVQRFVQSLGAQWLILDPVPETPFREAVRRVFGQDQIPEFDVQNAQYVLSFGADFLGTWLSPVHYGVQYGIFRQGNYSATQFRPRQGRPRGYLVQIEPHLSPTAANADEWLPVRPGREGLVALSIAQAILSERGAGPGAGVFGGAQALEAFQAERIAPETGIAPDRIRKIAREFAARRPSLAIGGGLAGAHTNGTSALSTVLALNQLVGNIGQPGGVRFNPAPAIGGLPTGVRANSLSDWQGLTDRLRAGQVQAVLMWDVDPIHGLPSALQLGDALMRAPFVASFSSFLDETTLLADLILPSHLPLEDWGDDVPDPGPGVSVVTFQQPLVPPFFDTRSVWDVLLGLGRQIGGPVQQALPWATFRDLLREGARSIQQLNRGTVQDANFESFWTKLLQRGGWWDTTPAPPAGAATAPSPAGTGAPNLAAGLRPAQFSGSAQDFPFHLVLFRHHTLGTGETAHLPWLQATPDPITSVVWQTWVEVSPKLAADQGVSEGDIVTIESTQGRVEVPVYVSPAAPPDVLAVPLGQGHTRFGRWAERRGVNPMTLLAPLADEATGSLAYGATRVRLSKTGRRIALPKLEGAVEARQLAEEKVLKVTRGEG